VLAILVIIDRQLHADLGALLGGRLVRCRLQLARGVPARAGAGGQQAKRERAGQDRLQLGISTILPKFGPNFCWYSAILLIRSLTRVRSLTSPASWPQAASMSSPRVLRMVVTMPPSIRTWAKALMRGFLERSRPDSGNGLNGIRLNLHETRSEEHTSEL